LTFGTRSFQSSFAPHAAKFAADIPNYTNVVGELQISAIIQQSNLNLLMLFCEMQNVAFATQFLKIQQPVKGYFFYELFRNAVVEINASIII
jgi:fumarate reductase subunit D